jgi:hypothetical protein
MRFKPPHVALALAALLAFPLLADEPKGTPAGKPAAPAAESAMKIHVDPVTGQVVSPKSDPAASRGVTATSAQALPPLKVEKGTTKAGGRRVNLRGRFMMEMTASVGPDGKVSHGCDQVPDAAPKAAPAKEHRHDR